MVNERQIAKIMRVIGDHEKRLRKLEAVSQKRGEGRPQKQPPGKSEAGAVDTMAIVNKLKERDDFAVIQDRVINKSDVWNKIRLILLSVRGRMTSGEIAKVFAGFDLKTDRSGVSNKLKDKSASLVTTTSRRSGGPVPRYGLSGPARSAAEKWLNDVLK